MIRKRVIPILLLSGNRLVKTRAFKEEVYIGDPINAVKIFNDKEVDELILLDITASSEGRPPDFSRISEITSESFMPLCYGGGISKLEEVKKLFFNGVEKVALNSASVHSPRLISEIASRYGNQSVVVSIDVKKDWRGRYKVYTDRGSKNMNVDPVEWAVQMQNAGAGEILLTSVEREGSGSGYDLELIKRVADSVSVPVVANGGAASVSDFAGAIKAGASAVAGGSMFVFHGKLRGVLINFPAQEVLVNEFYSKLQ